MHRGILLHGPAGTGKSYTFDRMAEFLGLVKTNPTETDAARFLGGYVGDTEKKIKLESSVAKLRPYALHVMILDECETLLEKRDQVKEGHKIDALNALLPIIA